MFLFIAETNAEKKPVAPELSVETNKKNKTRKCNGEERTAAGNTSFALRILLFFLFHTHIKKQETLFREVHY